MRLSPYQAGVAVDPQCVLGIYQIVGSVFATQSETLPRMGIRGTAAKDGDQGTVSCQAARRQLN